MEHRSIGAFDWVPISFSEFKVATVYSFSISMNRDTCVLLRHMGAHTMIRDSNRWTAVHHCAAGGCARTTSSLLVYHSALSLRATDRDGNTPLHVASRCGHASVVEMMISRGADITACNDQMLTCLDIAIEFGREKLAEVLIKNDK